MNAAPWHSPREPIYHDQLLCVSGAGIALSDRHEGTGGRRRCNECAWLASEPTDRAFLGLDELWDLDECVR